MDSILFSLVNFCHFCTLKKSDAVQASKHPLPWHKTFESGSGVPHKVRQIRNKQTLWEGKIRLWGAFLPHFTPGIRGDACGRKDPESKQGDWAIGDQIAFLDLDLEGLIDEMTRRHVEIKKEIEIIRPKLIPPMPNLYLNLTGPMWEAIGGSDGWKLVRRVKAGPSWHPAKV